MQVRLFPSDTFRAAAPPSDFHVSMVVHSLSRQSHFLIDNRPLPTIRMARDQQSLLDVLLYL